MRWATLTQAERIAASARWRAAHPGHLDLAYAPGDRTKWDLFPAADHAAPCLVFIHGGWWQFGARQENAIAAAGVAAHGWSAALPGYTLAPAARLSDMSDEITRALDWLVINGPAHGIAGPVLLAGYHELTRPDGALVREVLRLAAHVQGCQSRDRSG